MSKHTSFRIGGNAAALVICNDEEELSAVLGKCTAAEDAEYMMIGNGSNFLVSDDGYQGIMIRLGGSFDTVSIEGDSPDGSVTVRAGAAKLLSAVSAFLAGNGLAGMEFASGIPGSVGGAVFMNAGAYGGEMKDVVYSVSHLTPDCQIGRIEKENLDFGYRTSAYRKNGYIITGVTIKLKKDNPQDIQCRMDEILKKRNDKQPVEFPSAGSVFKRPEGNYAGALIEKCGFKGKFVGGAQVSEKHAGFIINKSNATAQDVKDLVKNIQETVKKETGYDLECELIML
jgi:UDP-N-acetylmuramate dehydrogenase